jgi:imidazolonepropionase-like amidohydrolase
MPQLSRLIMIIMAAAVLAFALLSAADAPTPTILVQAGHLIDGTGAAPRDKVTLVVRGGEITEVVNGFRDAAAGETVIDLRDAFVMPGLIDLHVHLGSQSSPTSYIEGFTMNQADFALRAARDGRVTLEAGFTTVRNPGDYMSETISLRDAIDQGYVVGPRIFSAGKSLATTGGHADPTNGWADRIEGDPGPKEGVINSPEDAAKGVRQRYKERADFIKITATGGVLSLARSPDAPQFTDPELEAVVRTARDYGFHVAAHAHGAEGMKRAIRAGVTTIEHGTFMDDEAIRLMKEHGTWYVPTISAGRFVGAKSEVEGFYPEIVRPKAAKVGRQINETFAKSVRSGVKIAFGTDSGVGPHGENAKEFVYMVEGGMKPLDAIRAATSSAAEVLGQRGRLGCVAAGCAADLVAVRADPVADISVLTKVDFVMKGGVVYVGP